MTKARVKGAIEIHICGSALSISLNNMATPGITIIIPEEPR
jgi:hypothetical protein